MSPRNVTDPRTLVAYHEAGHASMCTWLGITFKTASIIPDETTGGRVVPQLARWFRPDISSHPSQEELIRVLIQALLAGPEAERRVRGRYDEIGAGYDWAQAAELSARIHYSESAMRTLIRYSTAVVREAFDVRRCWNYVEAISEGLLINEELTYRAVRRIVGNEAPLARRWRVPQIVDAD